MTGRPPHIRVDDILDAARDVYREKGFTTTTAEIARRAGVSEGSIFYRFKTKEALIAALIDRETEPPQLLREIVSEAGAGSVAANLERVVGAVLESVKRGLPFFELLELSPMSSRVHTALRARSSPPPAEIVTLLAAYLGAEQELGRVRPMAHTTTGRAIFGACVDRVRSRRLALQELDDAAFVRSLVELVVLGLLPPRFP